MLSVDEAQARILDKVALVPSEWVPLAESQNRVLASDLAAARNQPPRPLSAMDGYALRAADSLSGEWLTIVCEIAAGHAVDQAIQPGEAARIFTGGVVPDGADAILIQEDAERSGNRVRAQKTVAAGVYVRPIGLDFTAGQTCISANTRMDARHLGLAASIGHAWLNVRRRPQIGIFTTGDELVWPGTTPRPDQISSSNTACLAGLVRAWGGDPVDLGIVSDHESELQRIVTHFEGLDFIISTGGASVGDHDLVRDVFGSAGLQLDFWKIAMRPGKPLIFGILENTPFLGLPGNPVSAAVCAIVFLRAAIRKRLGTTTELPSKQYQLGMNLAENGEREHYMRARLNQSDRTIIAMDNQDSSMFATFADADALLVRPRYDPAKKINEFITAIELNDVISQ